ncbi:MAG TPA: hypothetical protein VKN14_01815, partial [Flavobacteriaceae bacterium]|nr:hypothetical protein [Flavobacteriaceae bacterium]
MWTLFILLLSYNVIKNPKSIFARIKQRKKKYHNLDTSKIKKDLYEFMDDSLPFLDNNLTLPLLAESIGITTHELSYLINNNLK